MNAVSSIDARRRCRWPLVTLAAICLALAAVVLFTEAQSVAAAVVLVVMAGGSLVALGILRAVVAPLFGAAAGPDFGAPNGRTRGAIERDKRIVLRHLKELEFDRAMRKISDADFEVVAAPVRARAVSLLRQLDEGCDYRADIERELARRLAAQGGERARLGGTRRRRTIAQVQLIVTALTLPIAHASAQGAPDLVEMAGQALPSAELADGTVLVRVVSEDLTKNVVGVQVTVTAAGMTQTAETDNAGRARLTGLTAGVEGTASVDVAGEHVMSHLFRIPARGGIRVILAAGLKNVIARRQAEARAIEAAPPVTGTVRLGGDTGIIIEFREDALQVLYTLDIVNAGRSRVDIGGPLTIELPPAASGASVLPGSASTANVADGRITVRGPFAPGMTPVRVGFRLTYNQSDLDLMQQWPVPLDHVTMAIEKLPGLQIRSQQFSVTTDVRNRRSNALYLMGKGPAQVAGAIVSAHISGLPVRSAVSRSAAIAAVVVIVLTAAVLIITATGPDTERQRQASRKEELFRQLVKLERQHSMRQIDNARYASTRRDVIGELEIVYASLDGVDESTAA